MDIEQLYRDFNIPYATDGHKHCRDGWVNTPCPFCTGNPGLHLGYDTIGDKFVCWRCGGKFTPYVIKALLNVDIHVANEIIKQYGGSYFKTPKKKRKIRTKAFKLPPNTELKSNHKKYLIKRGFDPDKLVNDWNIKGTGVSSLLGNMNFKHRIIIPFIWDNKIVTFDSRDITDKSSSKYIACEEKRELIGRKRILYGSQKDWKDTGICVEGPTDVWRLGKYSFATSGIKYTPTQVRIIAKTFKRVFIIFDNEHQAQQQALKLAADLKFRGVKTAIINIEGDPGSMNQKEANYLVKQLIK